MARLGFVAGLGGLAVAACATEEEVLFGDPSKVVGSGGGGPTTVTGGTGTGCDPDPECGVSFQNDVFPIFADSGGCGEAPCHEVATSDFQFDKTDPAAAHAALVGYQLAGEDNAGPYIVGCAPESSRILCNLEYESGVASPFGECGVLMPQLLEDDVDDLPITGAQQEAILEWIECGAPDN